MILQVRDSAGNVIVQRDGLTGDEALELARYWLGGLDDESDARIEMLPDNHVLTLEVTA